MGWSGWIAALGALAGLGLIAGLAWLAAPVREHLANIRGEGEVARLRVRHFDDSMRPGSTRELHAVEHADAVRADGRGAAAEPPGGRRPPPTEGGSPESLLGLRERGDGVRAAIVPLYEARRTEYGAIAAAPSPTIAHGLRRLELWSELKVAWARALRAARLDPDEYRAYAEARPHPIDRLLVPAPDPAAPPPGAPQIHQNGESRPPSTR